MNLNLNYEGFEDYLLSKKPNFDGIQYLFRFENHYGASIIKHRGSYGYNQDLWELAVIYFGRDSDDDFMLDYDTEITDDVVGYLKDERVRELLKRIKEL